MPQRLRSKARTIAPLLLLLAATTISCDSRKKQPKLAAYFPQETSAVLQVDSSLVDLLGLLPSSSLFFGNKANLPYESLTFLLLGQSDSGSVATLIHDPKNRLEIESLAVGTRVASDDDSGPGLNAHLNWRVPIGEAGPYWLNLTESSDATAHEIITFDDDGAGGVDSYLYWVVQEKGLYWIQLDTSALADEQLIEGTISGIVGSDSLSVEIGAESANFWGPFSLKRGEEISVETSTISGDPKLSLIFLPPDTGTLTGIIGDSTLTIGDLDYALLPRRFGPFYLEEGDIVDITTNTIFDAFLELNADPRIERGFLDIYPLGMGWTGAQPSKAVTISADPSFDLSTYSPDSLGRSRFAPLLTVLMGLVDWESPIAGAFILSENYRARLPYIESIFLLDTEREILRQRIRGFAIQGYKLYDKIHLDIFLRINEPQPTFVTVNALLEDILYRVQHDPSLPLAFRLALRPPNFTTEQVTSRTIRLSLVIPSSALREVGLAVISNE